MSIPMIPARWHGGPQTARRIVIHGTVSPCAAGGARATAQFFARETNKTSAHYVVDPGEVVQCLPDNTVGYHAPPNQDSIGIELCDPQTGPGTRWADAPHKAMLARAAALTADLCIRHGIPVLRLHPADLLAGKHGISGHVDVSNAWHQTDHTDPGPDFPWPAFLTAVRAEVARRQAPAAPAPLPPTELTRIRAQLLAVAAKAGPIRRARILAARLQLPKR